MSDSYRYAARSGKTTLYKFRSYRTDKEREWVRQIVEDHKVYFSRASQINDPFDMSPQLEEFTREELLAAADRHFLSQPKLTEQERFERRNYLATCDLSQHAANVVAGMRKRIEDGFFVFSLAGNRNHPMLWSHYAFGHTGLCVHFRADESTIFGASMGVIYDGKRARIPVDVRSVSMGEIFNRSVLHKGEFWSYEEEYRLLRLPNTDYSDVPIRFDGQHAYFPSSVLSGITVGVRMSGSEVDDVLKMAARHTPPLRVWRAKEAQGFALAFDEITLPMSSSQSPSRPVPLVW